MSDITLSAGVRQNLLSLQKTADLMSTTQNRLATGKKVNSALDNPTNFFTSESLQARSNDLGSLMDAMTNGIKTLEAADNGLTAITKNLESMQSTLRQARQDKSFETASFTTSRLDPSAGGQLTLSGGAFGSATTVDMTTTGSGQYAKTTSNYAAPAAAAAASTVGNADVTSTTLTGGTLTISYQGKSVDVTISAQGASGDQRTNIANDINAGLAGTALDGLITVGDNGTNMTLTAAGSEDGSITVSGTSAAETFGGAPTVNAGSDGKTEFTINDTKISLDTTTGANLTTAVDTINAALGAAGEKFQAYSDGSKLGIRATTTDAGSLTLGGADANLFGTPGSNGTVGGTTSAGLTLVNTVDNLVNLINNDSNLNDKIKASNDNGKLRIQNLSTQELTVAGTDTSGNLTGVATDESKIAGNTVRADLASQYNILRDQLDKLSDDASYNGINLLRGDKLKITFNETGTSSLEIQAKNGTAVSAANLGVDTYLNPEDLDTDSSIDSMLTKMKSALDEVRSQASTFGSNLSMVENREEFTKHMMNTLQTGADNLVLADTNEEAANMLALQTRQQLSSTALSMASQADQAPLQLFG